MSEPSDGLRAFVPGVQLDDVAFAELHARRSLDGPAAEPGSTDPRYTLSVQTSDDADRFRLILSVDLALPEGDVHVTVVAEYTLTVPPTGPLSRAIVVQYANEVGVMTMLPYLRQGIADLTQRVFGSALLMPVMPRGAISFPVPEDEE